MKTYLIGSIIWPWKLFEDMFTNIIFVGEFLLPTAWSELKRFTTIVTSISVISIIMSCMGYYFIPQLSPTSSTVILGAYILGALIFYWRVSLAYGQLYKVLSVTQAILFGILLGPLVARLLISLLS